MWKRFRIFASGYCRDSLEEIRIHISASALIICAVALLTVPLDWVLSWMLAVLVHEICHYIALRLLCVTVSEITIGATGVLMQTGSMSPLYELISAIAGPLGGLSLVFLGRFFPPLGVCALLQNLFNLIPVHTLDGGRIVRSILILCFGEERGMIANVNFQRVFCVIIIGFLLALSTRFGFVTLLFAAMLVLRIRRSKISLQRDKTNSTI